MRKIKLSVALLLCVACLLTGFIAGRKVPTITVSFVVPVKMAEPIPPLPSDSMDQDSLQMQIDSDFNYMAPRIL